MRMNPNPITGYDPQAGRMRLAPLIAAALIGGGASIISGLLNRKTGNTTSSGTSTTSTTPTVDPRFAPLLEQILNQHMRATASPYQLPRGYDAAGVNNVNQTFDLAGMGLENKLANSGQLASFAGVAGQATLEGARGASISDFLNSLPLLAEDRGNQRLQQAQSILPFGIGSTSFGTTTGAGTVKQPNDTINNLAAIIGYMQASGAFNKPGTATLPAGNNSYNYLAPVGGGR